MRARLYVVQASHPCWAVARALALKGIPFTRFEWPPTVHVPAQRLLFGQGTVPGLKLDGERMIGSRRIMHRLDELRPDPPLYPSEPDARERIEEIDLWGDEVLQALARRFAWWTLRRRPAAATSYSEDSRLPIPAFAGVALTPLISRIEWRMNDVSDENTRHDVAALPGHLDRIDAWIREGLLGGDQPNAADLQIGSSIALLNTIEDLRPLLEGRPTLELARSQFETFPGRVPAGTLPAAWFAAAYAAA